jgi:2-amino-4-hydroxy-6-hydroxymethyldihydropteridine diphosphokinase
MTGTGNVAAGRPGPGAAAAAPGSVREVVLSLGSNLGDRLAQLQLGVDTLASAGDLALTAVSGIYQTAPVGGPDQDDYFNVVALGVSALSPAGVLVRCAAAEQAAGRVRTIRWGPRSLDVDIIVCGELTSSDPALTLPHPRAHERAFVLVPWLEIEPAAVLPGFGPVAQLPAAHDHSGVRRLTGQALRLPAGTGSAQTATDRR